MRLRLDHSSVRWVSVHVAIPANVHSNSTADNASPQRKASSRVSSSVDRTHQRLRDRLPRLRRTPMVPPRPCARTSVAIPAPPPMPSNGSGTAANVRCLSGGRSTGAHTGVGNALDAD